MKLLLLISVYILISNVSFSQDLPWNTAKNWKIYAITGPRLFRCPTDSLQFLSSRPINRDSMNYFLQKVEKVPLEKKPVWMGAYLTSCEMPAGHLKKVLISSYGGFFYDPADKTYYILPLAARDEWLNYLSDLRASLLN